MVPEHFSSLLQELALLRNALSAFGTLLVTVCFVLGLLQIVSWFVTIWAEKKRSRNGSLERDLLASRRARIDRQRMGQELQAMIKDGDPKTQI